MLLDTNYVIALFAGDQAAVALAGKSQTYFLPAIVLGELCYGAQNSTQVQNNLAKIAELQQATTVLPCDEHTAETYGKIKHGLRLLGKPIPENDIWIAALARQHELPLATLDKHFAQIVDLKIVSW